MTDLVQDPVIETQDLTRRFGSLLAVEGLDLAIHPGEIFGIVGPDGAGKTTSLRLLAGLLKITRGSASVLGRDLRKQAERIKPHIGYMAQQFSLYADLSVRENIDFFSGKSLLNIFSPPIVWIYLVGN